MYKWTKQKYKKKENNIPVRKHFRKKKVGLGIVVVHISWHGHCGYKKKLDLGINRDALKLARIP